MHYACLIVFPAGFCNFNLSFAGPGGQQLYLYLCRSASGCLFKCNQLVRLQLINQHGQCNSGIRKCPKNSFACRQVCICCGNKIICQLLPVDDCLINSGSRFSAQTVKCTVMAMLYHCFMGFHAASYQKIVKHTGQQYTCCVPEQVYG